jgi:hypothetical protein
MTIIAIYNSLNCRIAERHLKDDDATTGAIAQAAIDLIQATMSLHEGDSIKVWSE